jgi:hypothetical protein
MVPKWVMELLACAINASEVDIAKVPQQLEKEKS